MNRVYRTVFNHALGLCQVVGEQTRRSGKAGSGAATRGLLAGALLCGALNAQAEDIGGTYQNLSLTSGADITQSQAVMVSGNTDLDTTGNIALTHAGNSFGGTVNLSGNFVALNTSTDLQIGTLFAMGNTELTSAGQLNLGDLVVFQTLTLDASSTRLSGEIAAAQTQLNSGTLHVGEGGSLTSTIDLEEGTTLQFERDDTVVYSASASGDGALVQAGAGNLALAASNTYTGGTTVSGGTLTIYNDASLGAVSGDLTLNGGALALASARSSATLQRDILLGEDGGSVSLAGNQSMTFDGRIGGTGSLTKNGAGSLIIGNPGNDYSGGTLINAGNITLSGGGSLGSGPVTLASLGAGLGSGRLYVESDSSLGDLDITLNGGSSDLMVYGSGGNATLLNAGGGSRVIFSGSDADAGEAVVSNQNGSVYFQDGASGGVAQIGNVAGSGESAIVNVTDASLGNATLVNQGSGTNVIAFAGSSDASSATLINGANGQVVIYGDETGTALSIGSLSGAGAVVGYGGYDFSSGQSLLVPVSLTLGALGRDDVIDGDISGDLDLTKTGSGTLVLNGHSATLSTRVEAGTLSIGGAGSSGAVLAGDVSVYDSGTLGGIGTLNGNLEIGDGGTLAPGNSIGTLSVNGDVNFASGSTYQVEANAAGAADQLLVDGQVSIDDGAVVSVLAEDGAWAANTRYSILSASEGVSGAFDSVSSNLAFLNAALSYDDDGVQLSLTRNDIEFASVARTFNQASTATALGSMALDSSLPTLVTALSEDGARAAYDSLSGEIHASARSALFDDSRYLREAIGQRLRAAQGDMPEAGMLHADADSGLGVWLQGYGSWGHSEGDSNVAGLDQDHRGSLLGLDLPLNEHWRLGAAAGYASTSLDASARSSSAHIDSHSLTLYAGGQWDALRLRLGAAHAWNDVASRRNVDVGSLSEREKADYDVGSTQFFGELGYALQAGAYQLEPFAALAHVQLDGDAFRERGGDAALQGSSQRQSLSYSTLGVHASSALAELAGVPLDLQASLGWQHAFGDTTPDSRLAFAGSQRFSVDGVPAARNIARAELGVQAQLSRATRLGLAYAGGFGDGYRDNGLKLSLDVSF